MAQSGAMRRILFPVCLATFLSQAAMANEVLQAARSGDAEALTAALAQGDPVDAGTLGHPLFFAAQGGHTDAVSVLLDHGADPNTALNFGSALQKAARGNHVDVVNLLIQAGADPNLTAGEREGTPLHDAADRGASEAALALLAQGADVNARNNWGLPPIHLAARKKREEMVVLLEANGARPIQSTPISAEELTAADMGLGRLTAIGCSQCHEIEPGVAPTGNHSHGPSLIGILGRTKGSVEGFPYSDAMKEQLGEWTVEELNRFLADPPGVVPGTDMALSLELGRAEQIALIAYLSEL